MRLSELRLSEAEHSHNAAPKHRRLRHRVAMLAAFGVLLFIGLGFVDFLSRVPPAEEKPSRNADGIVVLTGGSRGFRMRWNCSLWLCRLLISGVHPTNG